MLVLASNSPRRKQLLSLGGWVFSVLVPEVNECVRPGELPADYVRRLAENKAHTVVGSLKASLSLDTLILAADTAVVDILVEQTERADQVEWGKDGSSHVHYHILGKPVDATEAESMLRRLRGRTHQVYTAVVALRPEDKAMLSEVVVTDVPMRQYNDDEILTYVSSGDPLDKAGAYAIQHSDFKPVEHLEGCYANVMGLPICHLTRMLAVFGVYPEVDVPGACQKMLDYPCPISRQVLEPKRPFVRGAST